MDIEKIVQEAFKDELQKIAKKELPAGLKAYLEKKKAKQQPVVPQA
jgi:hypothetical protein